MLACSNLYDVFNNICSDEKEHVKTMTACRDYSIVDDLVQVGMGLARSPALSFACQLSCMQYHGRQPPDLPAAAYGLICCWLSRPAGSCTVCTRGEEPVAFQDKKRRGAPGAPQPSATMDTSQLQ